MRISKYYGKVHCAEENPMILLKDALKVIQERIDIHDAKRKLSKNHSDHDAESCYEEATIIYNIFFNAL